MPTTAPSIEKPTSEANDIEEAVSRSFDRSFERGINKRIVLSTFESALAGMKGVKNKEAKLRDVARAAAMSTAKRHGNIIQTGRYLLTNIEGFVDKYEINSALAINQMLLGLAEATCQIGPIVYGRFLEVANEYKEDADTWICQNRRLPAVVTQPAQMPSIVPFEDELIIRPTAPVQEEVEEPASEPEAVTEVEQEPVAEAKVKKSRWTSSGKKSIFRRLTDVLGGLFSGTFR